MKNYKEELKKFKLTEQDFPEYKNAESYSKRFKRCSIYKYENISYSNDSSPILQREE